VVRQHLDFVDSESAAPAFLGKGKIHAYGEDIDVRHLAGFLVEPLGLRVAHGRIERRHHAEDAHMAAGTGQSDGLQTAVHHLEIGRRIAGLQFRPDQGLGISAQRCCSWSFHISSCYLGDFLL
jgi:hypothetical protein